MQDERLRDDAKQLLQVAYERQVVDGLEGMRLDLAAAAEHRGLSPGSSHLVALMDFMEVAGWIEPHPAARDNPIRSLTARGLQVLREVPEPGV